MRTCVSCAGIQTLSTSTVLLQCRLDSKLIYADVSSAYSPYVAVTTLSGSKPYYPKRSRVTPDSLTLENTNSLRAVSICVLLPNAVCCSGTCVYRGCNGALPPTCQTHLPQTDYYHDDHPPACASTGATYAWAANCANPTAVDGSCQGVALCPINGAAATATATCTAVGWVVTNNCQPARCAAAPGAPPNGTSTCSVPGILNQVRPPWLHPHCHLFGSRSWH